MTAANSLLNFDPTQFNQMFQGAGAVGPQFDQGAYNQAFGNYSSAIQPMLSSIGQMNADALNRTALPGMTASAIQSGNMSGTKVPMNAALLAGETAKANANAAAQMYGQGAQQGNQLGGAYGQSMADAINAAMLQNSSLGNQLNFRQGQSNAEMAMRGLQQGGDLYGNLMSQSSPYWGAMVNAVSALPGRLTELGTMQRDAPMDWLKGYQDLITNVGTAGAPSGGAGGGGGSGMAGVGQGIQAGAQVGGLIGDVFTKWKT
jgi:hypothetical protein